MRNPLTVVILPETKNEWERRSPLIPQDVRWLINRKIPVEVVSSTLRTFKDHEYRKVGARVIHEIELSRTERKRPLLLVGVKEPPLQTIAPNCVYLVFSHTTKGQVYNRPLLKEFLKKKVTLVDYEHIVDWAKQRLVYFGRFAGICGAIDSLHFLGMRLLSEGITTPLIHVRSSLDYGTLEKARRHLRMVAKEIRKHGFPQKVSPFVIGVTGHGNVGQGAIEVLDLFRPIEIHPNDMKQFIRHQKKQTKKIYKIVFNREEKLRSKANKGFYFEEYLKYPKRFESNLDQYLPHLNLLINTSYWDKRYPRLVPENMIRKLYRTKKLRTALIGDLTCDVRGTIEITKKTTTPGNPTFVYDPKTRKILDGFAGDGIAVLAVDNLPCEFPKDASREFGAQIRDYVYQIAAHGVADITEHAALPREVREAVITQNGRLSPRYRYMRKYLK